MKRLTSTIAACLSILCAATASADPVDPALVILGNDGRFNAAPGICLLIDADQVGQCVTFIQDYFVSPPGCDGHLRSDSLECGKDVLED